MAPTDPIVCQAALALAVAAFASKCHETTAAQVVAGIRTCVAENLVRMGQMGMDLVDHLRERHPALPIDPRFGSGGDPIDHLPPLNPHLRSLLAERNA